jgi:glycosyltransferase involved in cell wall biosynthesis
MEGYNWQKKRPRLNQYAEGPERDKYIYFDSMLWKHENCKYETNTWRAAFMRACKSSQAAFSGGFFGFENHPDKELYRDLLMTKYLTTDRWLEEVRKSVLVFNTPSVFGGHGWKLCEFMAMGKAIISSPLNNDLPKALEHGKHIHFVEKKEELEEAVNLLLTDKEYRKQLSRGAREYYLQYQEPKQMIRRLINS